MFYEIYREKWIEVTNCLLYIWVDLQVSVFDSLKMCQFCRKITREHSILFSWTPIRTTTWTTTRGWLSLWRLGGWSGTTTPYGMDLWWPHLMRRWWITSSIIEVMWWSSTSISLMTPGLRSASSLLEMALPCAAASSDHSSVPLICVLQDSDFYNEFLI